MDDRTQECIGTHAALQGTHLEALEPIRQRTREHHGNYTFQVNMEGQA